MEIENYDAVEEILDIKINACGKHKIGFSIIDGYLNLKSSHSIFIHEIEEPPYGNRDKLEEGDLLQKINSKEINSADIIKTRNTLIKAFKKDYVKLTVTRGNHIRREYLSAVASSLLARSVYATKPSEVSTHGRNVVDESVFEKRFHPQDQALLADKVSRMDSGRRGVSQRSKVPGVPEDAGQDSKRLTLDHNSRVKIEKLEVAFQYLGIKLAPSQMYHLRERLHIDSNGSVAYGEFVREARAILDSGEALHSSVQPSVTPHPAPNINYTYPTAFPESEVDRLKSEVQRLKDILRDKELAASEMEDEILRIRKEEASMVSECRQLQQRASQVDELEEQQRCIELDYCQVISILETELAQLKTAKLEATDSPLDKKRLTVLSCQLRKAQKSQRILDQAVQRLLTLAKTVKISLSSDADSEQDPNLRMSPKDLAIEANRVEISVRQILQSDQSQLDFACEEVMMENGDKYYLDHLSQSTHWNPPATRNKKLDPLETKTL